MGLGGVGNDAQYTRSFSEFVLHFWCSSGILDSVSQDLLQIGWSR